MFCLCQNGNIIYCKLVANIKFLPPFEEFNDSIIKERVYASATFVECLDVNNVKYYQFHETNHLYYPQEFKEISREDAIKMVGSAWENFEEWMNLNVVKKIL